MTALLELKQRMKMIYAKYDIYLIPASKMYHCAGGVSDDKQPDWIYGKTCKSGGSHSAGAALLVPSSEYDCPARCPYGVCPCICTLYGSVCCGSRYLFCDVCSVFPRVSGAGVCTGADAACICYGNSLCYALGTRAGGRTGLRSSHGFWKPLFIILCII